MKGLMIVTCMNGGLGNQMFQYAMARSLADRIGDDLYLDIRDLKLKGSGIPSIGKRPSGVIREFGLQAYPVRARVANPLGLALRGFWKSRKLRIIVGRLGWRFGTWILEKGFPYQDIHAGRYGFTYLEGYWQSWRYFQDDRKAILGDFTPISSPVERNLALLRKMSKENSVSIHVRLGDYIRSKTIAQAHGNLTPAYYRSALQRLKGWGRNLRFYLFSDEPNEALRLLGPSFKPTIVDQNGDQPHEDIRLMTACRYFVTANSSFSWWGAWLSERHGKRVIAPKNWFSGLGHDTKDLIPKDWARI